MNWQNAIGGLLEQYASGSGAASRQEARDHYDQISSAVPTDVLGQLIGPALASLGSQQVSERVYNSATEMSPDQRGSLVGTLLQGLGSSVGAAALPALLGQLGVNRSVIDDPTNASPDDVAKLATHAHENDPSLFERAMSFYAEHPTLVKVLGTMAVAAIARNLSARSQSA
ncbi:MAG TPA: hypothetical protein VFD58_36430 [Blastocatellia bacterium]|nr:hypothetical protein [Blastocatellia bacterium]